MLLAAVPLTVPFSNSPKFLMCLKHKENQNILHVFFCSTEFWIMKPRIPKRTSGHLGRSFFFSGVQRSN